MPNIITLAFVPFSHFDSKMKSSNVAEELQNVKLYYLSAEIYRWISRVLKTIIRTVTCTIKLYFSASCSQY